MPRFDSSTPVNGTGMPARTNFHERPPSRPESVYDPNAEARRCSVCGARSGWRRWFSLGGGWAHCPPRGLIEAELDGDLRHVCGALCALRLGGVA